MGSLPVLVLWPNGQRDHTRGICHVVTEGHFKGLRVYAWACTCPIWVEDRKAQWESDQSMMCSHRRITVYLSIYLFLLIKATHLWIIPKHAYLFDLNWTYFHHHPYTKNMALRFSFLFFLIHWTFFVFVSISYFHLCFCCCKVLIKKSFMDKISICAI